MTDWLAVAALILSMLSLVVSVENRIRDRYKIDLYATLEVTGGADSHLVFVVIAVVTNTGKRPITIVEAFFQDHAEDHPAHFKILTPLTDTPAELHENQVVELRSRELSLDGLRKNDKFIDVVIRDSRSKTYFRTIENESLSIDWNDIQDSETEAQDCPDDA